MAGGAHLTSPLAATGFIHEPGDLYRYNVRLQTVESLCKSLNDLEKKLTSERLNTVNQLKSIEKDHIDALKQAFERIHSELENSFKTLQTALEHVREELQACQNEPEYQFSSETHLFLNAALHLSDRQFVCLNLPVEVARRVLLSFSGGEQDSTRAWERLMRERRCRVGECPRCQALRASLEVTETYIPDRTEDSSLFNTFISQREDIEDFSL